MVNFIYILLEFKNKFFFHEKKFKFISVWSLQMARTCWLYYFSKFIELLDTVSIVCSQHI